MDGILSAVFDAYLLRQLPEMLVGQGDVLPLFCRETHEVVTTDDKARRVWAGLEKRLPRDRVRMLTVSYLSELPELDTPLFHYIYKVFGKGVGGGLDFSDADVLFVTNTARKVMRERLRMMQFIRFQKAKDGTYLSVVSPDHNVLPLITDHFLDRFGSQSWLIYDARRRYGYYHQVVSPVSSGSEGKLDDVLRVTFVDDDTLAFDFDTGKLNDEVLSADDHLLQELWRTYFKAICIRERSNPRKQLSDMPRRYWKYMTEKQ